MCTVTFIPNESGSILTSNRDESTLRPASLPPKTFNGKHKKILFPVDPISGGSWIMLDNKGNKVVLLNGATENHLRQTEYRESRGKILLHLFDSPNILMSWETINLINIEPFTIVLNINKLLYQLQWNGEEKFKLELDSHESHIWSSSTLYSPEMKVERHLWFKELIQKNPDITSSEILNFHQYFENENSEFGLTINRENRVMTQSITQIVTNKNSLSMKYLQLHPELKIFDADFQELCGAH